MSGRLVCAPQYRNILYRSKKATAGPLHPLPESIAKRKHANHREHAQSSRDGLSGAHGPRDGRAAQYDRGEEGKLDAVGLAILDAITAEAVCATTVSSGGTPREAKHGGKRKNSRNHSHRMPTAEPAMMEGIDPVLAKPMMPPPAVSAARMYAG